MTIQLEHIAGHNKDGNIYDKARDIAHGAVHDDAATHTASTKSTTGAGIAIHDQYDAHEIFHAREEYMENMNWRVVTDNTTEHNSNLYVIDTFTSICPSPNISHQPIYHDPIYNPTNMPSNSSLQDSIICTKNVICTCNNAGDKPVTVRVYLVALLARLTGYAPLPGEPL